MTSIDWTHNDVQHLAALLDDVEIQAFLEESERQEAEFYQRLRDVLATLPDPPFLLRVRFALEDAAWRVRQLFTTP